MIRNKLVFSVFMTIVIFLLSTFSTFSYATGKHTGSHGHMGHMIKVRNMLKKTLGSSYDKSIVKATPKELADGKKIYQQYCAACHGSQGKGDGPVALSLPSRPADFTAPIHSKFYSDRGRIYIIQKGIPGTTMMGWEKILKDKDIRAVYLYIKSLRKCRKSEKKCGQ